MIKNIKNILTPLSQSLTEGKKEEFDSLYSENSDFIRAAIYWMVRDQNIDDIVQDTFLKAWKNFNNFENKSEFRTWLYRIAMNTTYDYLRKNKNINKLENEIEYEHDDRDLYLQELISKGILSLSLDHREAFILFYKFEYTQKEVAEILSISEGTAKSRIFYAKEKFAEFFKKYGGNDE